MTDILDHLVAVDPTRGRRATLCRLAADEIARLRSKIAELENAAASYESMLAELLETGRLGSKRAEAMVRACLEGSLQDSRESRNGMKAKPWTQDM